MQSHLIAKTFGVFRGVWPDIPSPINFKIGVGTTHVEVARQLLPFHLVFKVSAVVAFEFAYNGRLDSSVVVVQVERIFAGAPGLKDGDLTIEILKSKCERRGLRN